MPVQLRRGRWDEEEQRGAGSSGSEVEAMPAVKPAHMSKKEWELLQEARELEQGAFAFDKSVLCLLRIPSIDCEGPGKSALIRASLPLACQCAGRCVAFCCLCIAKERCFSSKPLMFDLTVLLSDVDVHLQHRVYEKRTFDSDESGSCAQPDH